MDEIDFILDGLRHNLDAYAMLHKTNTDTKTKAEFHLDKHNDLTDQLKAAIKKEYR